jgi:hypothetical protein
MSCHEMDPFRALNRLTSAVATTSREVQNSELKTASVSVHTLFCAALTLILGLICEMVVAVV